VNDERFKKGDVFQSYTMHRCVGVGGVSVVWAAQHNFLGYWVAIKVLQVRHANNARMVELAKAEAIALSRLRHVNLVEVRDAGITPDGTVWMAMPLLEGRTLREYLDKKKRLPILDALRFARDICDGARAAHEVGIVHRDLKPENTFLTDPRLEVVVLDLGMAKFQDIGLQSTGEGKSAMGTVRYMSPEHVSSKKVDHRTDQYAIGVMLYEMLWAHPYQLSEDGEVLDNYHIGLAHTIREPQPLMELIPGFPLYIWEVIARSMAKDRNQRYPSTREQAQAIRGVRKRFAAELAESPARFERQDAPVASRPGAEHGYIAPQAPPKFFQPLPEPTARVVAPPGAWTAQPSNIPSSAPTPPMYRPAGDAGPSGPAGFAPGAMASVPAPHAPLSHAPTLPVPARLRGEATPPPSANDVGPRARGKGALVVGAVALGAVLTVVLQLAWRGRGDALRSAGTTASAVAPEAAPTIAASTDGPAPVPAASSSAELPASSVTPNQTAAAPEPPAQPARKPPVVASPQPAPPPPAPAVTALPVGTARPGPTSKPKTEVLPKSDL